MSSGKIRFPTAINPSNGLYQAQSLYAKTLESVGNLIRSESYSTHVEEYLGAACLPTERINPATRLYGVELEVERKPDTPQTIIYQVYQSMPDFIMVKSDGSLSNGFEIVSAPATLAAHRKMWVNFLKSHGDKAKGVTRPGSWLAGYRTSTAGMHVHINRLAIRPLVLARFWRVMNAASHDKYFSRIAGRPLNNTYCRPVRGCRFTQELLRPSARHVAINLSPKDTIEVRIFRSNTDLVGMLKNLDFIDAMISFCEVTPSEKCHGVTFLEWMHAPTQVQAYPYLTRWLKRHRVHLYNDVTEVA